MYVLLDGIYLSAGLPQEEYCIAIAPAELLLAQSQLSIRLS